MDADTPIRRQYLAIKRQYPGVILFFRLGDFYETFDDDARLVSRELEIVLTGREMGKGHRVPLAGIPYHAADNYVAKLIGKGYKVAICEQMQDPALAKGLVDRQVVRVITAGTVVEPHLLSERRNNYLVALVVAENRAGLAYADISTGEFAATQLDGPDAAAAVQQEMARLQPAEVIQAEGESGEQGSGEAPADGGDPTAAGHRAEAPPPNSSQAPPLAFQVSRYPAWHFSLDVARRVLLDHFAVGTLDGFGLAGSPQAIQAAGALLQYVAETQKAALSSFVELKVYSPQSFMTLDAATRRNLEIFESTRTRSVKGSLLGVLDATRTAMGGRLLRR